MLLERCWNTSWDARVRRGRRRRASLPIVRDGTRPARAVWSSRRGGPSNYAKRVIATAMFQKSRDRPGPALHLAVPRYWPRPLPTFVPPFATFAFACAVDRISLTLPFDSQSCCRARAGERAVTCPRTAQAAASAAPAATSASAPATAAEERESGVGRVGVDGVDVEQLAELHVECDDEYVGVHALQQRERAEPVHDGDERVERELAERQREADAQDGGDAERAAGEPPSDERQV